MAGQTVAPYRKFWLDGKRRCFKVIAVVVRWAAQGVPGSIYRRRAAVQRRCQQRHGCRHIRQWMNRFANSGDASSPSRQTEGNIRAKAGCGIEILEPGAPQDRSSV